MVDTGALSAMQSPATESMPRTGQPAFRLVGAVQRAFNVLDALAEADTELGTNEIARRTGINASSVSRLLATLVAAGLVEHVPDSGRYRLGLRPLQLRDALLARPHLPPIPRPPPHAPAPLARGTPTPPPPWQ